jgi:alkylation response protein AidB-like acyl-CoA dehydrogenase
MNFAFSEEQQELGRLVRRFLEERSPEAEVRRLMETDAGYDAGVWAQMAGQLGLQGLIVPEEHGGSGFSFLELTVVLEQMGAALLCAPYFSTVVLATGALLHSGDEAAQKEHLPAIAAGELIATLAVTEEDGRWDVDAVACRAEPVDGGWALTGTKSYVLDGHVAGLLLVAARTDAGLSLFAVDGGAAGLERTLLTTLDLTRKLARVELRGVRATLVGEEGGAGATLATVLDLAAVGLAAEQVGGAQRCLDMSVAYAKERIQFGRPIGSFQAVKHKCADMLVAVESAKSAAYYAGWCAAELDEDLPVAAAMAKAFCSEASFSAAAETIQVHGGIGFTWEHPAHLYFKRAKSAELLFGDPAHHRELLAQRLGF